MSNKGKRNFLEELRCLAAAVPQAVALVEPNGDKLTFAALQNRINAIAHGVTQAGIARTDVVALILPDGVRLMTNFLGVAAAAGCAVINPALRRAEMVTVLSDLEARAIIVDPAAAGAAEDLASELRISILNLASCAEAPPPEAPADSDVALLLHTSATTGRARIVPLTHSNLHAMAANTRGILSLSSDDRFLSMMPLFHLQGLLSSLATILAGGTAICTAGFDVAAFLSWVDEYRPTWYTAGPTLHHAILPLIESHPEILDRAPLRFVRSIGAPLSQALLELLEHTLRAPVLEGYGMTEAGAITSNAPDCRRRGSAGRTTGSQVAIMSDAGDFLPPGLDGEIVVRGPAVMSSYRSHPEANRLAFRAGWFRTGDLGRLDADGFLFVTGRIKDIINRGGEKILPGEIEEVLAAHPAVVEAVAFGVAHPTLGEDVAAAVVLRAGSHVDESEVRRFAGERIADFKLPRRIFFLETIPKGATGKASRADLTARFKLEIDATRMAPDTDAGQRLARIWQRILKSDNIGVRDNFFELGGDSLALTLMMAEADIDLSPQDRAEFLASPTIETLERIETRLPARRSETAATVALQPEGSRVPFFCIPGAGENSYHFTDLSRELGKDQPFIVVRDPRPLAQRGVYTVEQHAELFWEAIRRVRPSGPYVLGGYCYGGIVAFEIARRLLAAGQDVRMVVLFEVPTPGYPKVVRHWKKYFRNSAAVTRGFLRGERRPYWEQVRAHLSVWSGLFRRKRQAVARRALVAAGMQAAIEPMEPVELRNERAGRAYIPRRLECDIAHFLAADEHHSTLILDDARLGWRDVAGREFSVHRVPGIKDRIFLPPNVSELAMRVRSLLEHVNAESTIRQRAP